MIPHNFFFFFFKWTYLWTLWHHISDIVVATSTNWCDGSWPNRVPAKSLFWTGLSGLDDVFKVKTYCYVGINYSEDSHRLASHVCKYHNMQKAMLKIAALFFIFFNLFESSCDFAKRLLTTSLLEWIRHLFHNRKNFSRGQFNCNKTIRNILLQCQKLKLCQSLLCVR